MAEGSFSCGHDSRCFFFFPLARTTPFKLFVPIVPLAFRTHALPFRMDAVAAPAAA